MKLKALLPLLLLLTVHLHAADPSYVTRATLSNGLQVVIVRNALAPVVTVELNFKVGGDETPPASRVPLTLKNTWHFAAAPG